MLSVAAQTALVETLLRPSSPHLTELDGNTPDLSDVLCVREARDGGERLKAASGRRNGRLRGLDNNRMGEKLGRKTHRRELKNAYFDFVPQLGYGERRLPTC